MGGSGMSPCLFEVAAQKKRKRKKKSLVFVWPALIRLGLCPLPMMGYLTKAGLHGKQK